ncbi:MAG: molybdopterin-binding oxidoreductase [Phototrophicales bacterium]|nr:MAG: molybdopterin-binding oxidoreductase [Phototrophicales bacterium]
MSEEAKYYTKQPGILTGALVGGMVTAPLIALMYLADILVGLPFIPFDVFDWLARNLPGDVIRFGINLMIDYVITPLELGETSSVAKTLEHIQGIGIVFGIGVITGAVMYKLFTLFQIRQVYVVGGGIGLLIGVMMAAISQSVNFTATADPTLQVLWILFVFIVLGGSLSWIYSDLTTVHPTPAKTEEDQRLQLINRRQFLVRIGGATATITVMGAGLGTIIREQEEQDAPVQRSTLTVADLPADLPNMSADVTPAPGTRPEYTPLDDHYRIDISSRPPVIDGESYRLRVYGLVEQEREISLRELQENYEPVNRYVTMSCISNRIGGDLISTTLWTGVPLHLLLDDWQVKPEATYLKITSADSFDEYVSIDLIRQDPRIMLTYAWDGVPLKQKHGFPLRIHIPDHYGMKQPKWITDIEAVDYWDEGYWVRRRWSASARVKTTSVIDTVAVDHAFERDGQVYIPIGGIAYSGAKGISKVEIRINSGDWQEAMLREPLSDTTWVIWRYDMPFEPGDMSFEVRTYEGDGTPQIESPAGTFPDGATGIHSVRTRIPQTITPESTDTP